jgi:DNA-binding MurR/RpiR family transcriptional regulator
MHLNSLIDRLNGTLTKADRKIAEVLLHLGPEAAFLSSHEVARRAGTHPASAVRFARKLGYSGYPDLQAQLRGEALSGAPDRMRSQLGALVSGDTLRQLIDTEIKALVGLAEQVSADRLEDLARRVIAARRICVFGIGHAAVLAEFLALRLARSGYPALTLTSLDWQATDLLSDFGPGDQVIAIVLRQTSNRFSALADYCAAMGIGLSLLGDLGAVSLRSEGALILAASRGSASSQSILVPVTLINALILEVSRLDDGRSIKALERREELKVRFPA